MAQLSIPFVGTVAYPYLYDTIIAIAFGLLLPVIAVLHVRHAPLRASGAILGTVGGAAVVTIGLGGAVNVDLEPAALLVRGVWWWTIGKLWVETGVLPRGFGMITALGAALMFALVPLTSFSPGFVAVMPSAVAAMLDLPYWNAARILLGLWALALAVILARDARAAQ